MLNYQPLFPWIVCFRKTMMSSHKGMGKSIFGLKILTACNFKSSHSVDIETDKQQYSGLKDTVL